MGSNVTMMDVIRKRVGWGFFNFILISHFITVMLF